MPCYPTEGQQLYARQTYDGQQSLGKESVESPQRAPFVPKESRRRARVVPDAAASAPHADPRSAVVRKLDGGHHAPLRES